jgi:hypothetical protein
MVIILIISVEAIIWIALYYQYYHYYLHYFYSAGWLELVGSRKVHELDYTVTTGSLFHVIVIHGILVKLPSVAY